MNVHIFCIGLASVLGSKLHRNVPTGGSRRRPGGVRDALGRGVWKKLVPGGPFGTPTGVPFRTLWVLMGVFRATFWRPNRVLDVIFLSDFRHLFFISFLMDLSGNFDQMFYVFY